MWAIQALSRLAARVGPRLRPALHDERGTLLMETLIAVSVFTLLGAAVMTSMSATGRAAQSIDENATSENLARNQIETVLAAAYQDPPHTFATITPPAGYAVTAQAVELVSGETNIAKIIVSVTRNGEPTLTLESVRHKVSQ
jgi:type II secretory pathway pseudopilin PulG